MNKRGVLFATFTVLILAAFVIGVHIHKEKIFEEIKVVDVGKASGVIIDFALTEEETKFFLEKAMEYASFNSLKELGDVGGVLVEQECERINEHVIWQGNCFFYGILEEVFFDIFKEKFGNYVSENDLRINVESDHDGDGRFFLKTVGMIELQQGDIRYGFEPGIVFYPEYDFDDYVDIISGANDCVKEKSFDDCGNEEFNWNVKIEGDYVLFDVSKPYRNLGEVVIRFALLRRD